MGKSDERQKVAQLFRADRSGRQALARVAGEIT